VGGRSSCRTVAASASARRRLPWLQSPFREPAAGSRRGADDRVWLAGVGPANLSRRVPVALVAMATRARNIDYGLTNPFAATARRFGASYRDAFGIHGS